MNSPVLIPLSRGLFATVDAADAERVQQFKWSALKASKTKPLFYGFRHPKLAGTHALMHRFIMNAECGELVDHRDGNTLDNRRDNLRIATKAQNCQNSRSYRGSSRFKGVSWNTQSGKWKAGITANGNVINLGFFKDEETAACAYDTAARELHGEFARLNFPDEVTA
jgi:hypothetical protein